MATQKQNQDFANDLLPSYLLDAAVEWIAKYLRPEDVFLDEELEKWAWENGFMKRGD